MVIQNSILTFSSPIESPASFRAVVLCIKSLLPEGYIQTRLVTLSYATLKNMYNQRKNHRLPQWNTDFVSWVHTLPYSEFITDEWPEE